MTTLARRAAFLGSCALLSLGTFASDAMAQASGTLASHAFLDSIPAWLAQSRVPGLALATLENGRVTAVRTFGVLRTGEPLAPNALWNVASLTKPVVSMTTLRLVDAGRIGLDAPLDPYWIDPDIRDDSAHHLLTTRLVLSHQTGFPNWRWLTPNKKLAFLFKPGTSYRYSGEGFEYLRHALEGMTGRSLQQLSDSVLFSPLGMTETTYGWNTRKDSLRFVAGHDTGGMEVQVVKRTMAAPNGADWLVTTIGDYSRFGEAVLGRVGLSPSIFAEMLRGQVQMNGKPDDVMGLGWEVLTGPATDAHILVHTGSDDGIKTLIILLPDSRRGLVVFTNGDRGMDVTMRIVKSALALKALTP
ncbi:MAG: serine hydrolase domain-containing protein [bacterium]